MFYVLNVKRRNGTFFERLFDSLIKDEYTVQTIPVYKAAPFCMMDVTVGKRGVDWEIVTSVLGKCATRLVTNYEEFPEEANITKFKSVNLYDKIMKNTFVDILENNLQNHSVSISVLDENAKHTSFLKRISPYAKSLSVTTNNKEKYYPTCDEIIDTTGLCPILSAEFADGDIKINADKNIMTVNGFLNISCGDDFTVPKIYEKLLPNGIDRYDFYSALYELCGVFSLADSCFRVINVNNEKKRISDVHFA